MSAPLGLERVKAAALRLFGGELRSSHAEPLNAGTRIVTAATRLDACRYAVGHTKPRIADALARWAAVVERETWGLVSPPVRELVARNLQNWDGELMPISRSWVDLEVTVLSGQDLAIARLALVLAKAPYQVDERLVEDVLSEDRSEERFIRLLAWASFSGARKFAQRIAVAAFGQVAGLRMLH